MEKPPPDAPEIAKSKAKDEQKEQIQLGPTYHLDSISHMNPPAADEPHGKTLPMSFEFYMGDGSTAKIPEPPSSGLPARGVRDLPAAPQMLRPEAPASPGVMMAPEEAPAKVGYSPSGRRLWRGKYTTEMREKARELKAQGMSLQRIARMLGVSSPGTIRRWVTQETCTKETLSRRGRRRKIPQHIEKEIVDFATIRQSEGHAPATRDIIEYLRDVKDFRNIRPQNVGEILRRHGISMKPQHKSALLAEFQKPEMIRDGAILPQGLPDNVILYNPKVSTVADQIQLPEGLPKPPFPRGDAPP